MPKINNETEVTVLMSMYNTPAEQLKESIESILNQTYKEFEFLIINDGSKEECVNIVNSYHDTRINLVHNEDNIGLEKSLNKGVQLAKGQYIIRMDTDDIAYPNRIEKQLDFARKHPQYSIIGSRAEYFDEHGIYGESKTYGEIKKEKFLHGTPFIHPTLIMKKIDILSAGGYPLYKRCEDYAMEMELYCHGYMGYIMNEILIKYRMDADAYKKRNLNTRIIEAKMRFRYFKKLDITKGKYFYIIKPILAAITPTCIMRKYQKIKLNKKG